MVISMEAMPVLAQFQGEKTLDEIAEQFSVPRERLVELVEMLDKHALIWGPTFKEREAAFLALINEKGVLPRGAAWMLGEDEDTVRTQFDQWFSETEDPELETAPKALVLPHLDFHRGWPLFAAGYLALKGTPAPDRVVILGTNHFGIGDGVVGTNWTWETPLGRVPQDTALHEAMTSRLGAGFTADQLDHVPEHSIQLHLPWLQHVFGAVPVFAALIPSPLIPMISEDGGRTSTDDFVAALKESLADLGGTTLFIASSDLSHVGPQFGEPTPVDDDRKIDVEQHDRDMLAKFLEGDSRGFVEAMTWSKNPTRWCSVGNMSVLLDLVGVGEIELLDYRQAVDPKGMALVSSCACSVC